MSPLRQLINILCFVLEIYVTLQFTEFKEIQARHITTNIHYTNSCVALSLIAEMAPLTRVTRFNVTQRNSSAPPSHGTVCVAPLPLNTTTSIIKGLVGWFKWVRPPPKKEKKPPPPPPPPLIVQTADTS